MCLSTNVSGHNRVWAQTCVGTIVSGHNHVWEQSCLGTIVSEHKRIWAQSCGPNHVWAQTWWNHLLYKVILLTSVINASGIIIITPTLESICTPVIHIFFVHYVQLPQKNFWCIYLNVNVNVN